jgi:hypothetical protein
MKRTPIPANVLTTSKNSPKKGDVISVTANGYNFPGQVLKADVLTFDTGGVLNLSGLQFPFLAVVAKEIKFADPEERAYIKLPTDRIIPGDGLPIPPLHKAKSGNAGPAAKNGDDGTAGLNGKKGNKPSNGLIVPTLYLFTNKITIQPGAGLPNAIKLHIYCNGVDGGKGGDGQNGQDGGNGGDGGPSKWNGLWCDAGAGSGGNGGKGGHGGAGYEGGDGSNGGDVFYCGSEDAIDTFHYSKVYALPGYKGNGGKNGTNGIGGSGGARGAHTGKCEGGENGHGGATDPYHEIISLPGKDGVQGNIYHSQIDVLTLF